MAETSAPTKKATKKSVRNKAPNTLAMKTHHVAHQAQDLTKAAYDSGKDVALQCKNLACEGGKQISLWAKKHPKEAIAVVVAGLGIFGLISQRSKIKNFDAKKKVINPLVDKSHQAKSALSELWDRNTR